MHNLACRRFRPARSSARPQPQHAEPGTRRMRILVIGDPYCPSATLRGAFARLGDEHSVTFADVVDEPGWVPSTASERRIREATGSPDQVLALLDHHDVLVVQAAPVTEGVLEAAPSVRLVCCVRGGPVNVDVAAATARGVPVATTPGKNADAVAELTIAFVIMLARRLAEIGRFVEAGGVIGHDNYEGAQLVRPRPRGAHTGPHRLRPGRPARRRPCPGVRDARPGLRSVRGPDARCVPTRSSRSTCRRSCGRRTSSRSTPAPPPRTAGCIGAAEFAAMKRWRLPHQHRARFAPR